MQLRLFKQFTWLNVKYLQDYYFIKKQNLQHKHKSIKKDILLLTSNKPNKIFFNFSNTFRANN